MKERIGVYICHCGGNISDYMDVEQIRKIVHDEEGVVVAKDVMFACADSNQKEMIKDIREQHLDAIVVASCSPRLHLHTFRNVAIRAGINPYNYVQVNIREQCSWPHSDHPQEATVKATGLIRGGIGRVARSEALENIEISARRAVVVVGAGVAGMRAAIDLGRMGNQVFLIEKDHFVGGRVAQAGEVALSEQTGEQLVARLYDEIRKMSNITLFTDATLEKISGSLGNFSVEVKINPRYLVKNYDKGLLDKAIEECKNDVPDPFNYGMTSRKAIYKNYPGALPDTPVVDGKAIKDSKDFVEKYSGCIDLQQKPDMITLIAGTVLVTTGFDSYQPAEGEYGYKTYDHVITLPEFKRLIGLSNGELIYKNRRIRKIAFIYCVGNRQTKGENKYCSRFCCTSAIHTSVVLNEKYDDIKSFHLYRDIRTYGKQEILYEKSSRQGDLYFRFDEKTPPVVEGQGDHLLVKVRDLLTAKQELELEADLVVLVTGMIARDDSQQIAGRLKIPIGNDKFFNEIHPKLRPVETVIKGVYIGGSCQGPKNITESLQSSLAAAAKINALIKSGTIQLEPVIARVDPALCTWCGKCSEVCEYDAIKQSTIEGKEVATVNEAACKGCGICAPVCPFDAIELAQYTNGEIEAMIDGFMQQTGLMEKTLDAETGTCEQQEEGMKEFPAIWKKISESIHEKSMTIPEIADELGMNRDLITYHLMTMNKYNVVESDGMDDDKSYFYYKMKR
jgi:heterodisulfide reductase subunit A